MSNNVPLRLRRTVVTDRYGIRWELSMIRFNGRIEIVAFQQNSSNQIEFSGALEESDFGRAAGRLSAMDNTKEKRFKVVHLS